MAWNYFSIPKAWRLAISEWIISPHIILDIRLLIHANINLIPVSKTYLLLYSKLLAVATGDAIAVKLQNWT